MTREEAINYLKSSGMSDEQIKSVINALTCNDCISRTEAINEMSNALKRVFVEHRDIAEKAMNKLPSVTPQPKTAFNGTNGIRELIREFDDKHTPYAITQEYKDLTISQIIEYMVDIDDLLEDITYKLMEVEDEET